MIWAQLTLGSGHYSRFIQELLLVHEILSGMDFWNVQVYSILHKYLNVKRRPQDECRDCWLFSKNEIVSGVPRTIWSCFSGVHRSFVVILDLLTQHGYTISRLRPENSPKRGLPLRSLFVEKYSSLTIWKRVNQLNVHNMNRFWIAVIFLHFFVPAHSFTVVVTKLWD